MTVRIGKVELIGVQDIHTEETRNLVEQRVPDQKGSVFQDLGRDPVTVVIMGLLFGSEVLSNLEQLRQAQEKGDPLPFAADIAIGTELTEVIIEDLKMRQLAGYVDRYRFAIRVREHVEPPESPEKALAAVNDGIAADADAFAADSIAAGGALQDPSNLANVLADNPGALAQLSADDLAGAVADNVDTLSAGNVGEILKSVGTQDPAKMGGMLTALKEKGAMGGLLEKFADAGKSLKEMLKDVNLTDLAKGLVALFTAGMELIRLLKAALSDIKAVWKQFGDLGMLTGLREFLKIGIEKLRELIKALSELVAKISDVVKALEKAKDSLDKVAEKLNCKDTIRRIINGVVTWLSTIEKALNWIGQQLLDLAGMSGVLGMAWPVIEGGAQFVVATSRDLERIGIPGVKDALDMPIQSSTQNFGKFMKEAESTLNLIRDISETAIESDLDRSVFNLKDKLEDLRRNIERFQPDRKLDVSNQNSQQQED